MTSVRQSRILIIDPPFLRLYRPSYSSSVYPLALGYLASAVRENTDWDVVTYNADFNPAAEDFRLVELVEGFDTFRASLADMSYSVWQEIAACIRTYRPQVIGISVKTQNCAAACNIARIAKEIDASTTVVVGGPHPSMIGSEILDFSDFDIAVVGEGENTLVDLLNAIEQGGDLEAVNGIVFRRSDQVVTTPPRALIEDLDQLGFPYDYAASTLKDYGRYPKEAFKYIFAIRGCPYGCTFCGSKNIWSRKVRFRSPENVAKEIKKLYDQGINPIHFHDDTFGISREYIGRLCDEIRAQCPKLYWSCEIHANLVDEPTIEKMRRAGCFFIQMGVESGNDGILGVIKKKTTQQRVAIAADIIKRHGIVLQMFFMIGFPEETLETLADTRNAMLRLDPDQIIYSIFTPYPGTDVFRQMQQTGVIDDFFDASQYHHQSPNNYFCPSIPRDEFRRVASEIETMVDGFNHTMDVRRSIRNYLTYGKPLILHSVSPDLGYARVGFNQSHKETAIAWALSENATNKTLLCIGDVAIADTTVSLGGDVISIVIPPGIFETTGRHPMYLMDAVTSVRSNTLWFEVVEPQRAIEEQGVMPTSEQQPVGLVRRLAAALFR